MNRILAEWIDSDRMSGIRERGSRIAVRLQPGDQLSDRVEKHLSQPPPLGQYPLLDRIRQQLAGVQLDRGRPAPHQVRRRWYPAGGSRRLPARHLELGDVREAGLRI